MYLKKITFSFITILFVTSCSLNKKVTNTNTTNNELLNSYWSGEILISQESFISNIDKTCGLQALNKDSCILQKIKTSYVNKFDTFSIKDISIYKNKTIDLKLSKKMVPTSTENQQIKIALTTFLNGKFADSLICYSYLNNANNSIATEQLYYINDALHIWLLGITYEETSTMTDWVKQYQIELSSGKFILIK
jgi:hypothetical protein